MACWFWVRMSRSFLGRRLFDRTEVTSYLSISILITNPGLLLYGQLQHYISAEQIQTFFRIDIESLLFKIIEWNWEQIKSRSFFHRDDISHQFLPFCIYFDLIVNLLHISWLSLSHLYPSHCFTGLSRAEPGRAYHIRRSKFISVV